MNFPGSPQPLSERVQKTQQPTAPDSSRGLTQELEDEQFGYRPLPDVSDKSRELASPGAIVALQGAVGNRVVSRMIAVQRDDDELPTPGPIAPPKGTKARARWGMLKDLTKQSAKFNEGTSPTKTSESSKKTVTAGGAWLASQVNSKEKIGSVDDYMGSKDVEGTAHSEHLKKFASGAHAFITPAIHRNIHNLPGAWANFGGWGSDANFVAPLASADELVKQASDPETGRGIWELEEKLGIPKGSWVKSCAPDYNIWRYIVHDTKKFNLRIPSGSERGAYASEWWNGKYQRGQWEPKGVTEGGATEAVIDKISIDDMKLLGPDVFEMRNETSLAANTLKYMPDGPSASDK